MCCCWSWVAFVLFPWRRVATVMLYWHLQYLFWWQPCKVQSLLRRLQLLSTWLLLHHQVWTVAGWIYHFCYFICWETVKVFIEIMFIHTLCCWNLNRLQHNTMFPIREFVRQHTRILLYNFVYHVGDIFWGPVGALANPVVYTFSNVAPRLLTISQWIFSLWQLCC